jgi:5-methyltetrahydrofolate--homocysteine methyltransferase
MGKVVIGTVKGDLHDIGKNIASMMLEGAGFQVIDLGVNVSPEKIVEAVRQNKPNILGMSALLTTTMAYMKETITALKNEALRENIKIIIGGAPITEDFAREIGADGYAPDAATGVEIARRLIGQN